MHSRISVKPYQRRFRQPLRTARGEWALREGFLLRVETAAGVGYGEVAPIPDFGSETVAEARVFLQRLAREPDWPMSDALPCCAFALSAARFDLSAAQRDYTVSALLPAGAAALRIAEEKIQLGYQNLKWKIGVAPLGKELVLARSLLESLPAGAKLRLDANASLSQGGLERWLELLANFPEAVDYLEQPLPCGEERAMAEAMQASGVPIALDESLNGAEGSRFLDAGAWAGPLVVKAPLMGHAAKLRERLLLVSEQVVLSSVFETGIGLENALALADALPGVHRPIGFDTVDLFGDALNFIEPTPSICAAERSGYDPEGIWNLL